MEASTQYDKQQYRMLLEHPEAYKHSDIRELPQTFLIECLEEHNAAIRQLESLKANTLFPQMISTGNLRCLKQ